MRSAGGPEDQNRFVETLSEFFTAQSIRDEEAAFCSKCGARRQFMDAHFSLFGTEFNWDARLPLCPNCDLPSVKPQ